MSMFWGPLIEFSLKSLTDESLSPWYSLTSTPSSSITFTHEQLQFYLAGTSGSAVSLFNEENREVDIFSKSFLD